MLVPTACRFVPYDQWFVTHIDDASKVKHVKLWLLAKCNLVQSPGPHSQRSVSPIVFASSLRSKSSIDSLEEGYNEDDEFSDQDVQPNHSKHSICPSRDPKPGSSSQPASSPLVDQYTLISFSTGSILEDEFALSWYNLRSYELLEMHPISTVAPLQRDVLSEYIQPYFQARVKVLRAVWNHKSGRLETPGIDPQRERKAKDKLSQKLDALSVKSATSHPGKKRRTKVDWKSRWVVIHQGTLFLCKEHVTNPPFQQYALSAMTTLRGADALERAFSIVTQPRVVCIKFRPPSVASSGVVSPPPSSPSSPISDELKTNLHEPLSRMDSIPDLKQTAELEDPGEWAPGPDDRCMERGDWIVIDMLDDHAFSSILRILHRKASHPISSSFVPSPSLITVSNNSVVSPVASSFASYETIPYPEWRINTVENARKAGMGDVGKAMAWVLWSEKGLGESLLGNIRHHRQAFSQEMQYKTTFPLDIHAGSDDESDDESEFEWEGWMRDLVRQSRRRQELEKAGKSSMSSKEAPISPSTSLPSPPLSEASPSGSPRVRPLSLSVSHLASGSFTPPALYPNIGNVIQASGVRGYRPTEYALAPETFKSTTVSTVSVGAAPIPRRRSSTLLAELGGSSKRDPDRGKKDGDSFPRSPVNGTRASARTVSVSAGMQRSPNVLIRHARSSSNLRSSASPYRSDVADPTGQFSPSSPSRRQSAFMRGMSLRAGKLVKGLESAIDFVDEKSV